MVPAAATEAFEGVSGSVIVSITAFTIVFIVLLGLTAVIYAIKIFAGENSASNGKASAVPAPAPSQAPAPVSVVSATPSGCESTRVVAAITAAILAATGGRGRVLSVVPEEARGPGSRWTRTWRTAALIEQVGNRLNRSWKH